jgi:hypothetical protein
MDHPDEEGIELPDLSAATKEAELAARDLLLEAIRGRKSEVPEAVVITDETGTELYSLPFLELLPTNLRR